MLGTSVYPVHSVPVMCSHHSPVCLQIEQEKLASLKKQDEDKDKRDKEEKESSREKRERSRSPRRYDRYNRCACGVVGGLPWVFRVRWRKCGQPEVWGTLVEELFASGLKSFVARHFGTFL